jgi:hypothetical protein
VCNAIAPSAGPELLESCLKRESIANDLKPWMEAYKNATTKNVKIQIVSLYAHRFPIKKLQEIHASYENITEWKIKRARKHAMECGQGSAVEKPLPTYRVKLPPTKLDNFIDFTDRPYFYQDVAYGTRKLKLDSGETITMPNVICKIT